MQLKGEEEKGRKGEQSLELGEEVPYLGFVTAACGIKPELGARRREEQIQVWQQKTRAINMLILLPRDMLIIIQGKEDKKKKEEECVATQNGLNKVSYFIAT